MSDPARGTVPDLQVYDDPAWSGSGDAWNGWPGSTWDDSWWAQGHSDGQPLNGVAAEGSSEVMATTQSPGVDPLQADDPWAAAAAPSAAPDGGTTSCPSTTPWSQTTAPVVGSSVTTPATTAPPPPMAGSLATPSSPPTASLNGTSSTNPTSTSAGTTSTTSPPTAPTAQSAMGAPTAPPPVAAGGTPTPPDATSWSTSGWGARDWHGTSWSWNRSASWQAWDWNASASSWSSGSGGYRGDYGDPPGWPGWAHRRYWVTAIRRWDKTSDLPVPRKAEKVLRSLGWEMQPDFEHVPETVLNTSAYLDVIIEIINNKAGVREDDEKRRAFKSAIVDQHRHREESLSQFAVRRQKEFSNAAAYGVIIPDSFKATMLREGAGLNDQNQQNLTALLQGHDEDPNAVARALARLDVRSDRMAAYVEPHSSTDSFASTVEENDDEEEDSLDEAELMKELEPLDLTEDQVNEVFAVLENKKRKPRTWKENKLFKAEMRKERTSFVKGDDKTPHGRKPDGHFRGRRNALNREQLKKISRCKLCLKKGHWAEDCDMNKANKKSAPPSAFSYSSSQNGPSQSAFSYCTMSLLRESLSEVLATGQKLEAQWNFLTIPSGDAILDIGATQDLIGETALSSMAHHLKHLGLQFVEVDAPILTPAGIGGTAQVTRVVLVPISPGGHPGVLEFTVLEGGIPPLLSVFFFWIF